MSGASTVNMFEKLSPEQRRVVETWGRGMAVLAGAGSGKTTTLVVKCVELLKSRPEAKLCAVSFTERSAGDLREKLSAQVPLPGHWVMTIHGLCGSIIREFPRQAGYHGDERMLSQPEAEAMWERAIEALWFEDIPAEIQEQAEILLERESRSGFIDLLRRVRELALQGALASLESQELDPHSLALARVGRFVLERYERLKRRRGALDFSDLENGADRALEHEEVRQYYQNRFDLVMVDEFQDTNPLQASIVFRFVRPDLSNLCVVGDPKQSIYRFRDADVSVFEDCCARLPERLSLTWNFRSRPGVIDFSNQICAPAFEASQMQYEALVPKRELLEGLQSVEILEEATPARLASWIHSELARGVKLNEMALLLRKIRGKEEWLRGLSSAGISVAVGSGGLFWEDPRVREMTAFLKWWDNPGNALAGAVFLRAPWVGVSDRDIDAWVKQDPTLWAPFFASSYPLARRLRAWAEVHASVRPGQLLMELLIDEAAEQELGAPLLGLWHRAEELSSRGMDFHRVAQELSTAMEEKRRERDVPPPKGVEGSDVAGANAAGAPGGTASNGAGAGGAGSSNVAGQLVVLTVHASKGLEFPHVLILDLPEKADRARPMPALFWDRKRGAFLARRQMDGSRDKDAEGEWSEEEKRQELAESKRLFYVAVTRARERLVLIYPEPKKGRPTEEIPVADLGAAAATAHFTAPSAEMKSATKAPRAKAVKEPVDPRKQDFWRGWIESAAPGLPRIEVSNVEAARVEVSRAQHVEARVELSRAEVSQVESAPASNAESAFQQMDLFSIPVAPPVAAPSAGVSTTQTAPAVTSPEATPHKAREFKQARAAAPIRPRHSVTEWNLLSRCPRAYEWSYLRATPEAAAAAAKQGEFRKPKDTGPVDTDSESRLSQRELGTRVHACLETLDVEGLRALEMEAGQKRFQAQRVIDWAKSPSGGAAMFADPQRGSLADADRGHDEGRGPHSGGIWSELAFEVPVAGEVLVGSIDRLVQRGDQYEVIDFKVTARSKDPDALLEAYATQLRLYSWALGRMEPEARDRTRAILVNFSPTSIDTVEVPLPSYDELENEAAGLATSAANWVTASGRESTLSSSAPPVPGAQCRVCEFREACPAARF